MCPVTCSWRLLPQVFVALAVRPRPSTVPLIHKIIINLIFKNSFEAELIINNLFWNQPVCTWPASTPLKHGGINVPPRKQLFYWDFFSEPYERHLFQKLFPNFYFQKKKKKGKVGIFKTLTIANSAIILKSWWKIWFYFSYKK